ncbi:hypothetical protein C0S24_004451 [Salmonella enterica subsp. enterica serovar Saintpaul]|nr:hypothetical protein [Salmonella enterica subsp. enterica serovar Saintpaul]EEJ9459781.1 hypothetical protein [Salmonella enterica subsp. enterica serovar Infantis]
MRFVKDVAALLFLCAPAGAARGGNAACGQYPASGRARDGRRFRSWRALSLLCTRLEPSDERPSSRFRGISSPTMRLSVSYSTVGLTRYRTRGTAHRQQGTVSR